MKRILCFLLCCILLLTATACGGVSEETTTYADNLYENRVADATDIEANQKLVDAVLSDGSYGAYSIDVATYQSAHTLKITFQTLMTQNDKLTEHLYRIGTVLMTLTKNLHEVDFIYQYKNEGKTIVGTTCAVSQNRAKKLLGAAAETYIENADDVVKMLQILELDK